MDERRSEERLNWGARIRIEEPASRRVMSADSRLRNIAKHGFGFVTEDHLTRGSVYTFKMDLMTTPFEVQARIIHFHIEATYYVCGARIEGLSLLQRSRINHFLLAKSSKLQRKFFVYSLITGLVVAGCAKLFVGATMPMIVTLFFAAAIVSYLLLPF